MDSLNPTLSLVPASLLRRFGAICYDSLLLLSVLFLATGLFIAFWGPVDSTTMPWFRIYLLVVSFLYFASSWLRGGQTLGMMAWRIQLRSTTANSITWWAALRRFIMAIFSWSILGLGFWWAWWDQQQRTWHDLASDTWIVMVPKESEQP